MINAIILAAGLGERLRPLTYTKPKALVPVGNRPLLFYTLNLLKKYSIKNIAMNLFHLPYSIIDWITAEAECSNFNIKFSIEKSILGTGGGIKKASTLLDDTPFLVINSDILIEIDLDKLIEFHKERNSIATMVLRKHPFASTFGTIGIDTENRIGQFLDNWRPSWLPPKTPLQELMFTGLQLIEREFLEYIPDKKYSDLSQDVYPHLVKNNLPIYGYIMDGYWMDIGTPARYFQANKDYLRGKFNPFLRSEEKTAYQDSLIASPFTILSPVYLGKNCCIGKESIIGTEVSIGDKAILGNNTRIEKSIVWEDVFIGNDVKVSNCIILSHSKILDNTILNQFIVNNNKDGSLELTHLPIGQGLSNDSSSS